MSTEPPAKKRKTEYYSRDVDFDALAKQDPAFAAIAATAKRDGWIDFHNPEVIQQLTKSLLRQDFGLTLTMPNDRLCPPVPVRWNYVRWIQDLLDTTDPSFSDVPDLEREVVGLDIGVGASCIYSLLACSKRPEWRMAGTDIDAHSLDYAKRNVEANGLQDRIRLKKVNDDGPLIPIDAMGVEELDFVMTNPPFYSDQRDFENAYKNSGDKGDGAPSPVCVGAENEMICPNGDVGFVTRILEESLKLRARVQWYTAFLSKMNSLQQVIAKLKEHGIDNFAATSLHPGHKTKRYAVAWSFQDYRPRNEVARHGDLVHQVLPLLTAQTIEIPDQDSKQLGQRVDETIKAFPKAKWMWRPLLDAGVMQCKGNVWGRKARTRKSVSDGIEGDEDWDEDGVALAVKVTCSNNQVELRWLRGREHILFMGFSKKLKDVLTGRHERN